MAVHHEVSLEPGLWKTFAQCQEGQLEGGGSGSQAGLPHSHLHEKEVCPQAFPAKVVMMNHFCSTPAEIPSSSPVDSSSYPYSPLSTE